MMHIHIMSGPPGSGKTWEAEALAEGQGALISADHMHCPGFKEVFPGPYKGIPFNRLGDSDVWEMLTDYRFSPAKLAMAHPTCMRAAVDWVQTVKVNTFHLIVDNTNIHTWEISPYYLLGQAFDAEVEIVRMVRPLDVCLARNTHNVPEDIIERMHATKNQHLPWWVSRDV